MSKLIEEQDKQETWLRGCVWEGWLIAHVIHCATPECPACECYKRGYETVPAGNHLSKTRMLRAQQAAGAEVKIQ